ncbi:MAG: OmpA family protein [Sandaracinus sp.]|nr:OmpA family protein [Sandaracinus sp.]MCB9622123.1 OmpA family protein [Sandaracinus sp.]MCB9625461.1 OmpA family protein [Sandaracinus sp.]MCB9630584.1 OmpA family protein [Sandaracinus sp.]
MSQRFVASFALLACLGLASSAHAESGRYNLHLDLGVATPLAGELAPTEDDFALGFAGWGGFDFQLAAPFAIEGIVGGGFVNAPYPNRPSRERTPYFHVAVGARLRFLDNQEGYLNEEGGDFLGNFWVSAHLGYALFDGHQFSVDAGFGYEMSIAAPVQLGFFVRASLMPGGDVDGVDAMLVAGLSGSIELGPRVAAVDSDGDGLPNERELQAHGTDPFRADTDGDGLTDGVEVNGPTDPLRPDSDDDGLTDGQEDANANGRRDGSETDPTLADTDAGGVPDGYEVEHGTDPNLAADDDQDRDGVLNPADQCPDTAEGTEVDARGCAIIRARMVLPGIEFGFDSAEILPASERTLNIALQILRDNPDARVEVGGHTDNVGNANYNRRLSQQRADAVRDWLVGHGVAQNRMRTRGYGSAQPVAPNDTDEGRARNRRIEFKQLD